MRALAVALVGLFLLIFAAEAEARRCPPGWSHSGGRCVKFRFRPGCYYSGGGMCKCPKYTCRPGCFYIGGGKCRCPRR